jgi:O-acetyl-ADP-ribose deacetylase (regulator of RNase III)
LFPAIQKKLKWSKIMAGINYTTGDATAPRGSGQHIIVHICNDIGGWGRGFVLALSSRWKAPEEDYRSWAGGETDLPFELGQVQFVRVEKDIMVANLVGQRDVVPSRGVPPIRYPAVRKGLEKVAAMAQETGATVHMPRIGCGLAGGKWEEIEPIILEVLVRKDVDVFVYDPPAGR